MKIPALFAVLVGFVAAVSAAEAPRYRVGVCDWMILKRQKLGAFQLAKDIGADGVEVDMGSLGQRPTFDSKLGDPAVREQFLTKARKLGLGISSIAMSGFYAQSFGEREGMLSGETRSRRRRRWASPSSFCRWACRATS